MMALTLPYWSIPLLLTALIWIVAALAPLPRKGGDYDFVPEFVALFHTVAGAFATLIVWLIYFVVF